MAELRNLVIVLGDQLDLDASAFDGFDPEQDAVWMAEVTEESTHVWSSKPRIALFLSAMRHFAVALRAAGRTLHYRTTRRRRQPRQPGRTAGRRPSNACALPRW
jgi:deoxyribodipyrimidine photolyase-related protein